MTARAFAMVMFGAGVLFACSSDDSSSSSGSSGSTGTTESGLSKSFSALCARCHGPAGEGTGTYPRIPGNKTEDAFILLVRSGRGEMPAFTESQIADDVLRADYLWLTTKR